MEHVTLRTVDLDPVGDADEIQAMLDEAELMDCYLHIELREKPSEEDE